MLVREAKFISKLIENYLEPSIKNIVNLGSSDLEFNKSSQSYIYKYVISKLENRGNLINIDIKNSPGVSIVADFLTNDGLERITKLNPDVLVVSNLLEHIPDPYIGLQRITSMLPTNGLLIFSGPTRFPLHPDPIDNKFRPGRIKLKKMLRKDFEILELKIIRELNVLLATNPNKREALSWAFSELKHFKTQPKECIRVAKLMLYPASAFCCMLRKK